MPWYERAVVISSLESVDAAYSFDDSDGSAIKFIETVKREYPNDDFTNSWMATTFDEHYDILRDIFDDQ